MASGWRNRETELRIVQKLIVVAVLFFALLPAEHMAFAAEPIDADGPDFVESSEVIGKNRFQYEADLLSQRDQRTPTVIQTTSTPTLLKYGITDTIELRLQTEGYIRNASQNNNAVQTGTGDTALGLKWHSQDKEDAAGKPSISWLLHFDTPSGSNGFSRPGVRPSLRSVMTWELPQNFALGVMPGIKYDTANDGHRYTSGILGVVLNNRLTERFRAFVEMSAEQLAHAQDGGNVAYWDIGAAYLLTTDTQLGARAGFAANQNTPSNYFLIEVAQRF
jgi:hypothetical protein